MEPFFFLENRRSCLVESHVHYVCVCVCVCVYVRLSFIDPQSPRSREKGVGVEGGAWYKRNLHSGHPHPSSTHPPFFLSRAFLSLFLSLCTLTLPSNGSMRRWRQYKSRRTEQNRTVRNGAVWHGAAKAKKGLGTAHRYWRYYIYIVKVGPSARSLSLSL